jgi:hypothetical protein
MLWLLSVAMWLISPFVAGHVTQQHPPRFPRQGLGQRDELSSPTIDGPEAARQRAGHRLGHGAAVAAKAREVQLVQECRVQQRDLVALEATQGIR